MCGMRDGGGVLCEGVGEVDDRFGEFWRSLVRVSVASMIANFVLTSF